MLRITNTLIAGAGPAGLASAACLQGAGIDYLLLEKNQEIATPWRNHYDRLHLHTRKNVSALPFKSFAASTPAYPSRYDVVSYLEDYAREKNIQPIYNAEIVSIKKVNDKWITDTNSGTYQSGNMIIATGMNNKPVMANWTGMDSFDGTIIHSSQFKNGQEFAGKDVLVVGAGNSGCEQAICLYEHGARPALSVRSPVNVLPRDIFGFSVLQVGSLTRMLPSGIADKINAPLIKLMVGDITKIGFKKPVYGPLEQIEKLKKIPILDIGTIKLIKQGHIKVYGGIDRIEGNTFCFENNKQRHFDAIILATGYRSDLESFLDPTYISMNELAKPLTKRTRYRKDGLYFCGFYLSPNGMLREIGMEAQKIARDIAE